MYQVSDSDSKDSYDGSRFKTDNSRSRKRSRERRRSQSPYYSSRNRHRKCKKERSSLSGSESSSSGDELRHKSSRDNKTTRNKEEISEIKSNNKLEVGNRNKSGSETSDSSMEKDKYGPSLPPSIAVEEKNIIGPALPPHLLNRNQISSERLESNSGNNRNETTKEIIGPMLPPHLLNKSVVAATPESDGIGPEFAVAGTSCIGPELPPHLRQKLAAECSSSNSNCKVEDMKSQHTDDDDEEEVYGPLPVEETRRSKAHLALEERALQLKIDQLASDDSKVVSREEWMLELPTVTAANLGLGPRQFRNKAGPDLSDRSAWTDTPEEKAHKGKSSKPRPVDLKKEAEMMEIEKKDKQQEVIAKKHGKKHKQSLLDMHQDKLKKQKNEKKSSTERVPFSRETDLQVNRFDEAQKKAVLKKAQLLDDRFSRGQSKFL